MKILRGVWKLLVGVKDALVLVLMLLFFAGLHAVLTMSPTRSVGAGALVLDLAGSIVEQPADSDPLAALSPAGGSRVREYRLSEVVRALDTAAADARVKAVVLDLDRFAGGGQVTLESVGAALDRVRKANKPVLAYATGYTDDGYQLAAHASEIWLNPMGAAAFTGPGGSRLYYKGLIDRLGITTHVYRVGQFKSAVEPYIRADQSEPARAANEALAGALWNGWKKDVNSARPKAQLAPFIADPVAALAASGGNMAQAAMRAGIVDKLGDRTAFGARVAAIAGADAGKGAGAYKRIRLDDWVAANPLPTAGSAIGVVTVAGTISDGEVGPGGAGGATISRLIHDGLATKNLKALVVRIDSPGGSALASEEIRSALLDAKKAGLPVVVSMGSVAASGGYWVATAGDRIFAEPATITGSIGVFGVIPTFEGALAKIGITADGVTTTPLSGQPDLYGGTTPEFDRIAQAGVENFYGRFVNLVAAARKLPPARVDEIGQGRVWDGGSARQLGLVDAFGSLDDAIAEAARRANLKVADTHLVYLEKQPGWIETLLKDYGRSGDDEQQGQAADLLTRLSQDRTALLWSAIDDARLLAGGAAIQARCLECAALAGPRSRPRNADSLIATVIAWAIR